MNVPVPSDAIAGGTLFRIRVSSEGGLTPNSYSADGEVEDHWVHVVGPALTLDLSTISGTNLIVRRSGDNIEVVDGSAMLISQPLSATDSLTITGADDVAESVTVDYKLGGFFDLPSGIVFNAGEGDDDELSVIGYSTSETAVSAEYISNNTMLGNATIVADSGSQSTSIHFSGVEPVSILGMDDISLTGTLQVGTDTLNLGSDNPIDLPASTVLRGGTIQSSGQIVLGSGKTLTLQVADGYQPDASDTFNLITADGGVSGTFNSIVLPPIESTGGDDLAWAIEYDASEVRARIVNAVQVDDVVVNDGQLQRSSVTSVDVTFTDVVDIDFSGSAPFEFLNLDNDLIAETDSPLVSEVGGKTIVKFTFLPGDTVNVGRSLLDGQYQLRIDPAKVTIGGVEMDGNGDGEAGDEYRFGDHPNDAFFRKYGDVSGDDSVGLADFATFRSVFGSSDDEEAFRHELDVDFDGSIGLADFAAFRSNFGT